jgi:hypothetical protein
MSSPDDTGDFSIECAALAQADAILSTRDPIVPSSEAILLDLGNEERALLGMLLVSHIITAKTRHSASMARSILSRLPKQV